MSNEQQWRFEEAMERPEAREMAARVRELETVKDDLFKRRDYSLEWQLEYDIAMKRWARAYNQLEEYIRTVLA
jgi:hypothetical protein